MGNSMFRRVAKALLDKQIPFSNKLLYIASIVGYTIVPFDIIPINPLDYLLVAWVASLLFLRASGKKKVKKSKYDNGDIIDIEGDIVD